MEYSLNLVNLGGDLLDAVVLFDIKLGLHAPHCGGAATHTVL